MKTHESAPDYTGYRFPPEIISHAVWLYFRFSLSFRDVEELLAQRGIVVTYETVRQWGLKFGQNYANELRHRRHSTGDKWHQHARLSHDPWGEALFVASGRSERQCTRHAGRRVAATKKPPKDFSVSFSKDSNTPHE
jgi:hypothetical protein